MRSGTANLLVRSTIVALAILILGFAGTKAAAFYPGKVGTRVAAFYPGKTATLVADVSPGKPGTATIAVAQQRGGADEAPRVRRYDPTPVRLRLSDPPGSIRAEEGLTRFAEEVARRWPADASGIAARLGLKAPAPVEIVLLNGRTFRGWARGFLPEWGVGFASWPDGPIVLDVDAVMRGQKDLGEILRHEISHVYLGQRVGGAGMPRWFLEGIAQTQSGEWRFLDTMSLIQASSVGKLPELSRIGGSFPSGGQAAHLAYLVSLQAAMDLDVRLASRGGLVALVDATAESGRFDMAFQSLLDMTPQEYATEFNSKVRVRYGWIAAVANIGTLFTAMTLLFLMGVARAYWRKSRRLAEMEEEEARLGLAGSSTATAFGGYESSSTLPSPAPPPDSPGPPSSSPTRPPDSHRPS